jgi:predicted Zn-dependent protease
MIIFRVSYELYGWSVRMSPHMSTPFRTRELAVREAHALARALQAHGQRAEVIVDPEAPAQLVGAAVEMPSAA